MLAQYARYADSEPRRGEAFGDALDIHPAALGNAIEDRPVTDSALQSAACGRIAGAGLRLAHHAGY